MDTKTRRQDLLIYLADASDKKVNALYTLLEEEIRETSGVTTDEQWEIIEKRHSEYLSGKSKPVPWKEAHDMIRNNNYKS